MDMSQRLEHFLDPEYDFLMGRDCKVDFASTKVNSGSFFMRGSKWTEDVLENTWHSNGTHVTHVHIWWDNAGLIYALDQAPDTGSHLKIMSATLFNAPAPESCSLLVVRARLKMGVITVQIFGEMVISLCTVLAR